MSERGDKAPEWLTISAKTSSTDHAPLCLLWGKSRAKVRKGRKGKGVKNLLAISCIAWTGRASVAYHQDRRNKRPQRGL